MVVSAQAAPALAAPHADVPDHEVPGLHVFHGAPGALHDAGPFVTRGEGKTRQALAEVRHPAVKKLDVRCANAHGRYPDEHLVRRKIRDGDFLDSHVERPVDAKGPHGFDAHYILSGPAQRNRITTPGCCSVNFAA